MFYSIISFFVFIVFERKKSFYPTIFVVRIMLKKTHVLAVKQSLFVEIRFVGLYFFRPPKRYLHWAYNAMLDRPVACQMTKLDQIKA